MRPTKLASLASLLVASSACAARPDRDDPARAAPHPRRPLRVQTATVQAATAPATRAFFGTLVAEQQAAVAPLVSGRVEAVHVERGDRVRAGDPLLRVRDADLRDQAAQAAAALGQTLLRAGEDTPEARAAATALATAEDTQRRAERLAREGSASEQDLARARADAAAARAQLDLARQASRAAAFAARQARAQLAVSRRAATDAVVRAPFDGEVVERRVAAGDYVVAGTPALVLVRRDALRVRFAAPQPDAVHLHVGASASVTVLGLERAALPATVRYVSPALGEQSRALTVDATLDRLDPRLRPGQFAEVRVTLADDARATDDDPARARVARRALRELAGVYRAFVVRDGRLEERVLYVPEEPTGDEALVARGLAPGERVVLDPPDDAHDGAEVAP